MQELGTNSDLLEREAHCWVTQLVSGEATVADAEALRRWIAQSPYHAEAYAAATARWKALGPAGAALRAAQATSPQRMTRPVSRRLVLGGAGAIAATAAVAYVGVRPPLALWPSIGELAADYRTATGEQRRIALADHVSVQLNTQSSIALGPAVDGDNQVRLLAGEAAFATSPETARLLVVEAGDGRAVASRARFDVRRTGDAVCVNCLEGSVRVERRAQTATIGAGRQIRYDAAGLGEALPIDPVEAAAWQNGVLIFRFTPLSDVVAEINRYRHGRVILLSAALAAKPVNGRFQISRIDEALGWIGQAVGARSRALPGGVVLLS
ncbi:FecR family protein [Bradyrhizobium sp. 2TAF24]|uniref:FecR family protein n=1 Tax=Bradyrhizobium sp. 2TAF24 TaxID=3233011 RepID=UPI003F8E851C